MRNFIKACLGIGPGWSTALPLDKAGDKGGFLQHWGAVARAGYLAWISLGLSGCDAFEYQGPLPHLKEIVREKPTELGKARSLHIKNNSLSREAARELQLLTNLDSLTIEDCHLADSRGLIQSVSELFRLKRLVLHGTNVNDTDLTFLVDLNALEHLDLAGIEFSGRCLETLAELNLRSLKLRSNDVTAAALASLAELHSLEELHLEAPLVTIAELPSLAKLSKLRGVTLGRCDFSSLDESNGQFLLELPQLETLSITSDSVNTGAFRVFARIEHLKELELLGSSITNAHLLALAELQQIKSLKFWNAEQVTLEVMPSLVKHRELETLILSGARIRRDDLQILEDHPSLVDCVVGYRVVKWHGKSWREDHEVDIPQP